VGWRPDLQDEIQDAEKPEAGRHGDRKHQEACLAVLLAEDGALPHRVVPLVDKEPTHRVVLVVPVPGPDSGASLQGVS